MKTPFSSDRESITISYTQDGETMTTTQEIKMVPELLSILIAKEPRTTYAEGENFDITGMEVVATYSDGSVSTVSGFVVEGGENLTKEKTSVIISYTENGITKTAEQKISVSSILMGDADGNNKIDFRDILVINKHRLGKTLLTGKQLVAADVNKDGEVNFRDILKINKYRLGKIDSL